MASNIIFTLQVIKTGAQGHKENSVVDLGFEPKYPLPKTLVLNTMLNAFQATSSFINDGSAILNKCARVTRGR